MRFIAIALLCGLGVEAADAGKRKADRDASKGPSASASEIPQLDRLLRKGGWSPTPEMSGRYNVGTILNTAMGDHRIVASDCFSRPAMVSPFIGAEMVASMQAGVSISTGIAGRFGAKGGIVKKVKFGTPTIATLESLYMNLSEECSSLLQQQEPEKLAKMYVVQEVLKAEIAEQTCGTLDAGGRFVGLGSADVEYAQACSQETLEPVAVGYRTTPLVELLPEETAAQVRMALGTTALRETPKQAPEPKPLPIPEINDDPPANDGAKPKMQLSVRVGNPTGVRYQWRLNDRNSWGVRLEGMVAANSYTAVGPVLMLERERRSSNGRFAFFIGFGGGALFNSSAYPGGAIDAGVGVLGDNLRLDLGAGVFFASSMPFVGPEVSYGWMW